MIIQRRSLNDMGIELGYVQYIFDPASHGPNRPSLIDSALAPTIFYPSSDAFGSLSFRLVSTLSAPNGSLTAAVVARTV